MEAARLLRHARRRAGLTQRALAVRVGTPQSVVGRIESGRVDPSVSTLSRLLRGCETTLEALAGSGEGIDLSLIEMQLRNRPEERIADAASAAASISALEGTASRFGYIEILRMLHGCEVRFLLIGGVAASALGSAVIPFEVEICHQQDAANLRRLGAALGEMNAQNRGSFTFDTDLGSLDVLATPSGTSGFEDLAAGAESMDLGGFPVDVAALDDLIRVRRAAGRPKDRVEVENLIALRDLLTDRGEL